MKLLNKKIQIVEDHRLLLKDELSEIEETTKEMESMLSQQPLEYGPTTDLKGLRDKYVQLRLNQEDIQDLKEEIESSTQFIEDVHRLETLIKTGIQPDNRYVKFSEIRSLMKSLWLSSLDIFKSPKERAELHGLCLKILDIRKPTTDIKFSYDKMCFNN